MNPAVDTPARESTHPSVPSPGLDWAEAHMPLLRAAFDEIGEQFGGLRIAMCLHIEPKTAVLCRQLVRHGATVALTGSPGTTRPEVVAALARDGVLVHADVDDTAPRVADVLAIDPHLLLDNGADLTTGLLAGPIPSHFLGGTEETTTGALLLRARAVPPPFPVVVINDSALKLMVENRFGVGQSVVQGFMNATNLMLPGAAVTVVGYGPCGRGVAQTLRQLGALVTVVDTDPYRALEALMEGCTVRTLHAALPDARLLFLATGAPGVIGPEEVALLGDGVVVAGVGHHAWEADVSLFGPVTAAESFHRRHQRPDGRQAFVLAETRMINLVAGLGNPLEAMDLGLTLQARSLAAVASGRLDAGVQGVPADLDRAVAEAFVAVRTSGSAA